MIGTGAKGTGGVSELIGVEVKTNEANIELGCGGGGGRVRGMREEREKGGCGGGGG